MKKIVQFIFGFNVASLIRGLRFGLWELFDGSISAFCFLRPFQNSEARTAQLLLATIPKLALGDILADRKSAIQLRVQQYEDGMLPNHEAMALLSILVVESPREVLEIGTFMGHTTKAMAENLPESIIHTVDLPLDFSEPTKANPNIPKDDFHLITRRVVGREFQDQIFASRIRQHFGDTALVDFKKFGQPTFFFVDGSHTYEYCRQDSEKCYALCGGRGTFLWHDCDAGHPGVVKFIAEWRALGRNITRIEGTSMAYWKNP